MYGPPQYALELCTCCNLSIFHYYIIDSIVTYATTALRVAQFMRKLGVQKMELEGDVLHVVKAGAEGGGVERGQMPHHLLKNLLILGINFFF
jgi:hypothetical protein